MKSMSSGTFSIKWEHLQLLPRLSFTYASYPDEDVEVLPEFNHKRMFGNTTSWVEVAEMLGMPQARIYTHKQLSDGQDERDGFPCGYSCEQVLQCKQLLIELPVAMKVIFQYRTFEPGTYLLKNSSTLFRMKLWKNYLYLLPVIKHIEELSSEEWIEQLHVMACNLVGEENPYQMLLESLSSMLPDATSAPKWSKIALSELNRLIAVNWDPSTGRVPSLTEAPEV